MLRRYWQSLKTDKETRQLTWLVIAWLMLSAAIYWLSNRWSLLSALLFVLPFFIDRVWQPEISFEAIGFSHQRNL